MKRLKYPILFFVGGGAYCLVEILWRGYTHISMLFVGGAAFILLGLINEILSWETPLYFQVFLGTGICTLLEFFAGIILNILMNLQVWDYSDMPGNILGQVCPQFALAWIVLSLIGIVLDDYLRYWLWGEEKPHYVIW